MWCPRPLWAVNNFTAYFILFAEQWRCTLSLSAILCVLRVMGKYYDIANVRWYSILSGDEVMLGHLCFFLFEYLSQSDRESEWLHFVIVSLCEIVSFSFGFVAAMMGLMAWFLCDRRWTKDQNRRQFRVEMLSEEWAYDAIDCRGPLLTLFDCLRDVDPFCNIKDMNLIGFVNVLWSVPPQSDRMGICLIGFAVCDAVDCGVGYFSVLRWFDWLFVLHFFAISVCFLKSALIVISEGVRF